jgi:predicted ester cyclase
MPTTTVDPKVGAGRFNHAFNAHDEKALRTLIAPNATFTAPGDVRLEGKEAVLGYTYGWLKAFPDARINITNELVSGPWVVQEFIFEGTHTAPLTGPMGTIQATHRKVSGRSVSITRYENDLQVETRLYFDMVQLLSQLGVMPVPAKN